MAGHKIDVGDVEPDSGFVGSPPATIRAGRQVREDTEKPDSLNTRLLAKAQVLSDNLFETRKGLREVSGEPVKSSKLSQVERKTQYKELIASQEMLFSALAGAAIVGRDGKLRISTAMVDAFRELSDAS